MHLAVVGPGVLQDVVDRRTVVGLLEASEEVDELARRGPVVLPVVEGDLAARPAARGRGRRAEAEAGVRQDDVALPGVRDAQPGLVGLAAPEAVRRQDGRRRVCPVDSRGRVEVGVDDARLRRPEDRLARDRGRDLQRPHGVARGRGLRLGQQGDHGDRGEQGQGEGGTTLHGTPRSGRWGSCGCDASNDRARHKV